MPDQQAIKKTIKAGRPPGKKRETAIYQLHIEKKLMEWLRKIAEKEDRSLRSIIEEIIRKEQERQTQTK